MVDFSREDAINNGGFKGYPRPLIATTIIFETNLYLLRIDSYSAFYDNSRLQSTGLLEKLRERRVTHVYVCGLALDVCVAYTALHAAEEGFCTTVVLDACRGVSEDGIRQQLGAMAAAGVRFVEARL